MRLRRTLAAVGTFALTAIAPALLPTPAHAQDTRSFAVVLCRPTDDARQPRSPDWFSRLFTADGVGTGGLYDYWQDVSYGSLSIGGSQVFTTPDGGWFDTGHTSADENTRSRIERFDDCVSAAEPSVDFGRFYGIIALYNNSGDFGALGQGQVNAHINGQYGRWGQVVLEYPDSVNVMTAAHEMGHALGLPHSYDDSTKMCSVNAAPGEYCDPWDIMSAAVVSSYQGGYGDNGNYGNDFIPGDCTTWRQYCNSGPGLNAPNLDRLGWLGQSRRHDGLGTIYLAALNHPEVVEKWGQPAYLEARIPFVDDPDHHYYTIEYRVPDGWDRGIGTPTVLIHEVRPDGRSYLITTQNGANGGSRGQGAVFHDAVNDIAIIVNGLYTDTPIANVTITHNFTPTPPPPDTGPLNITGGDGAGGCGAIGCGQHPPGWQPHPIPFT